MLERFGDFLVGVETLLKGIKILTNRFDAPSLEARQVVLVGRLFIFILAALLQKHRFHRQQPGRRRNVDIRQRFFAGEVFKEFGGQYRFVFGGTHHRSLAPIPALMNQQSVGNLVWIHLSSSLELLTALK